jgi:hypothetical protein
MLTLTGEEVTIRREGNTLYVDTKKEIMSLRLKVKVIFISLQARSTCIV